MEILQTRRRPFFGLLSALMLLAGMPFASAQAADCQDVVDQRGYLNVLTLNLLFSEVALREERFQRIAKFLGTQAVAGDPVDLILLQEVVGGALVGTDNSAEDLRDILAEVTGEDYELRTVFETGLPGVLATANAILSRCDIRFHFARFLPLTSESVQLGDLTIPISRNIMMVRVKVPGFGRLNVYNTHLCAGDCTVAELGDQAEAAIDFVNDVERFFSFFRRRPHVLGGDFNQDNFRDGPGPDPDTGLGRFGPEIFIYDNITLGEDFEDAYAEGVGLDIRELCQDEAAGDEHCTVGVSTFNGSNARRIDYVFVRNFGPVVEGQVTFNSEVEGGIGPSVSDHAGVLVQVNLPGFSVSATATATE